MKSVVIAAAIGFIVGFVAFGPSIHASWTRTVKAAHAAQHELLK